MLKRTGLKKWELALILALAFALIYGVCFGAADCCAWWGTIYPELSGEAGAYAAAAVTEGETVVIRFRIAEYIAALLQRLRG